VRGFLGGIVSALALCTAILPSSIALADSVRDAAAGPAGLRNDVLNLALRAYECGKERGHFEKPYLTVIDYSLPSSAKRLWVLDMEQRRVLFNELVAHGKNSGVDGAMSFSNTPGSRKSSLGLFRTEATYRGRHGYSLNLEGLEPGFNDRALERRIVVHGANYVSPEFLASNGRLGRSYGCPALDRRVSARVIDLIKDGSAVFAYYPDSSWIRRSAFISCDSAATEKATRLARSGTTLR
jgi:hypothetical protein